jgi:hypothetical protein
MAEVAVDDIDRPTSRPFTLGDAMILIVALGLGLALARPAILEIAKALNSVSRNNFRLLIGAVPLARMLNIVLLDFLFVLLPALMILRLRRPRPPLRSILTQPGVTACAMPVAMFFVILPFSLLAGSGIGGEALEMAMQVLLIAAAPLAWICLLVTRRWNSEPSWIDRAGRTMGVLQMVCVPAHFILIHYSY